jgi:hypothetical protein
VKRRCTAHLALAHPYPMASQNFSKKALWCARAGCRIRLSAYARALEIERVREAEEARKAAEAAERDARDAEQREHEAIEEADHGVCDVAEIRRVGTL